jgi:protein tyrosine phosphatase|uniref:helix-turn-helix domain-containing protein n=1 Tax=Gelidibacter sp. TaxID=2018083 RepID=UPI00404A9A0E
MKILTQNEYTDIISRLESIEFQLREKKQLPTIETIYESQSFMEVMNISKRTAHNWRSEGIIPYSQIGVKFYYKHSDILELINKNYVPIIKKKEFVH